jgi:hypothetical protein
MGQISRTTNPTDLRRVDKKHFVVRVHSDASDRVFWLEHFDHSAAGLPPTAEMACIAHAGNTEEYVELGPVSGFRRQPASIRGLATDRPLRFRFIFNKPGESLLCGYADGVKAVDESGQLGSSLVDIEPAELGGIAWKLILPEKLQEPGAKPNVLVEKNLFPTAQAAAHSPWFGVLVMPEVMRQIAGEIAANPGALDDPETWPHVWADFIAALGVDPPADDFDGDQAAQASWVDLVVEKFAAKGVFKHHMDRAMAEMDGDPK